MCWACLCHRKVAVAMVAISHRNVAADNQCLLIDEWQDFLIENLRRKDNVFFRTVAIESLIFWTVIDSC